jgi:plastocyanin
VSGDYDGELPHVKVMAVMHVYMAKARVSHDCGPLPADLKNEAIGVPGRDVAPVVKVPLTGLGPDGRARTIDGPAGPTKVLKGSTKVLVHNFSFSVPKLSIPLGAKITWRFPDTTSHDVTLANGPLGFSSLFSRAGRTYTQRFSRPGKYRLFCSLHPVVMHEVVDVRGSARKAHEGGASVAAGVALVHW